MEYISHEDYKKMMGKFQAEAPKGKLLKESWRSDPTDEEGEEHSLAIEKELEDLAKAGKIDQQTLNNALDYVSDHDYELFAHKLDAGYVLKQVAGVEEGNAFTAGLAKAKKGEEFKVDGKSVKDTSNYDAPIKETDNVVDTKLTKIADLYKGKAIKHEEIEKIVNALTGQGHEINARYVQEFLKNHDVQLDENAGEAKILGHVKNDIYKVQTPTGEVVELDFDLEKGDQVDDYGWEGTLYAEDDDYEYILPVALVPMGGGSWDVNPYYKEFSANPLKKKVDEYQFDQMYPDDKGPFEGKDVDNMIKEFLVKEDDVNWDRMDDEEAEEDETDNGIEEEEEGKPDIHSDRDVAKVVAQKHSAEDAELKGRSEKEKAMYADTDPNLLDPIPGWVEGLNPAPFQATGPTIQTVETKHNIAKLKSEERDQLKQYIETIRTVKEEINKMLNKTKMKEGGDNTNLIMKPSTVSEDEMDQGGDKHEAIEKALGPKHQVIHSAIDKIIQTVKDSGFTEGDAALFLQHEIEEKAKEYTMSQYDPH